MSALPSLFLALAFQSAWTPAVAEQRPTPQGKVVWEARLPGSPMRACAADPAHVYQGVSFAKHGKARAALIALDRKTGKTRWTHRLAGSGVHAAPLATSGLVVHGSFYGRVEALRAQDGKPLWSYETGGGLMSTPLLYEDEVWVGFIGGLAALDVGTGKARLRLPLQAGTSVLHVTDALVVAYGAPENAIMAFDRRTGEERWRVRGPLIDKGRQTYAGFQAEAVGASENQVYIPTNVAEVWAVDLAEGKKRWGYEPEGTTFGTATDGGTVFMASSGRGTVGTVDLSLVARVEAKTGLQVWRSDVKGMVASYPLLVGDAVLVPTAREGLVAFGRGDGERLWTVKLRGAAYWAACADLDGRVYIGSDKRRLKAVR